MEAVVEKSDAVKGDDLCHSKEGDLTEKVEWILNTFVVNPCSAQVNFLRPIQFTVSVL